MCWKCIGAVPDGGGSPGEPQAEFRSRRPSSVSQAGPRRTRGLAASGRTGLPPRHDTNSVLIELIGSTPFVRPGTVILTFRVRRDGLASPITKRPEPQSRPRNLPEVSE